MDRFARYPSLRGRTPKDFGLTLNGKPAHLSDLRGKVALVNFWATWCPPCVDEMPSLSKFAAAFKDKGVVVLGVSVDKDAAAYKNFIRSLDPAFLTARQSAQSDRWDEAITRYTAAIDLDPELADAWSGRAHALLQTKKLAEAHKDYSKAVKLDPYSAEGVSGLGICEVMEGNIASGTKTIEGARSKLNDDFIFTYNAACVYGRALEQTVKQPASPQRDKKADEFRKKAIADLQLSVKLGFPDLDWMKKDSDLDSLHGLPEFKRIVSPDEKHSAEENSGDDNNGDPKTAPATDSAGKTSPQKAPAGKKNPPAKANPPKTASRKVEDRPENRGGQSTTDDALKADLMFEEARP